MNHLFVSIDWRAEIDDRSIGGVRSVETRQKNAKIGREITSAEHLVAAQGTEY